MVGYSAELSNLCCPSTCKAPCSTINTAASLWLSGQGRHQQELGASSSGQHQRVLLHGTVSVPSIPSRASILHRPGTRVTIASTGHNMAVKVGRAGAILVNGMVQAVPPTWTTTAIVWTMRRTFPARSWRPARSPYYATTNTAGACSVVLPQTHQLRPWRRAVPQAQRRHRIRRNIGHQPTVLDVAVHLSSGAARPGFRDHLRHRSAQPQQRRERSDHHRVHLRPRTRLS